MESAIIINMSIAFILDRVNVYPLIFFKISLLF